MEKTPSCTLSAALQAARQKIDRQDARLLAEHVLGLNHSEIISQGDRLLSADELKRLDGYFQRRSSGEPLAYLVGKAGFYGRMLRVSPAVLIPRPETEVLVERALGLIKNVASPKILDLGTGSGAIALTLALERPDAQVTAIDISADALMLARANAAALGAQIDWRQGNWFAPLIPSCSFDLIVSNPPYIAADDPHLVGDGVCVEPRLALTDGADGLDCIRAIIAGAPAHLQNGAYLLLEHGHDQGEACRNLLGAMGFKDPATWQDLSGNDRISGGQCNVSVAQTPPTRNPLGFVRIK